MRKWQNCGIHDFSAHLVVAIERQGYKDVLLEKHDYDLSVLIEHKII